MTRKNLIMFTLGALTGSLFTLFYIKDQQERDLDNRSGKEGVVRGTRCPPINFDKEDEKVLIMNKDIYKKVARNYSNAVPVNELISNSPRRPAPNPYVIDFERFCEDPENEKITITYYEGDDTLVDEGDEIFPDISGVIGYESLNSFGKGSEDPDVVYVRNEKLGIDYEVIRNKESFKEMVLGES